MEEARLIGEYARVILSDRFGDADWIEQAVIAVMLAADRAIKQLSQSHVTMNASPLSGQYAMPARTKEELLASQQEAAENREIPRESKKKDLLDPAKQVEETKPEQPKPTVTQPRGWLL